MSLAGFVRAAGLALGLAASAAEAGLSDYQGAWLLSGRGCAEVYSSSGKGTAFKTPLDIFAPAFVISGKQLRTPMASCRIRSIRPVGDRQRLVLDCANGVAANDVTVLLATAPNGALRRYYSDQDPTGVDYQRCAK
ncbi:hypothetical protein VQ02_16530 [Methylobacterium variabile]|uniref:Alkaline proteinase inhibitor/ Outer membrane lipoprotein Omp19 domain-containing protein n=1 Tax=Methylobacterium variabile TaxID=298794 RepID=A0A0J6VA04_9HYPH|nr:hypothetical protein [Methylobacterium variabile]KMO35851.1 hypothetical protein VQ02_16530 [Methylobacterium variabile]